jgi:small-conductance mechanosensitive channel
VAGKEGKVIHIDFRYTTLENNEKIILIPNSLVFANTVSILRKNE